MAKYHVFIKCNSAVKVTVEADDIWEAEDKAGEMIDDEDFFKKFREDCDFFEPTVTHAYTVHEAD